MIRRITVIQSRCAQFSGFADRINADLSDSDLLIPDLINTYKESMGEFNDSKLCNKYSYTNHANT